MKVLYELLPAEDRRATERRAKRLLRTTPAAPKHKFMGTMRDALDTQYKTTKNVVAALTYYDGDDRWWSDVVFRKGKHKLQYGIACCSEQQALSCLKSQIAEIKATREHPLVADVRETGDYDALLWLGVQYRQIGYRYVERRIDGIRSESVEFLKKHGIAKSASEAEMRQAELLARDTVLRYVPDFTPDDLGDPILRPPANTGKSDEEIKLWQEAASFLLWRGIIDINDDREPQVIYRHALCVPDETARVLA